MEKLVLSPTVKNRFIVEKDFIYKDVLVQKGYETNGADIPRLFWIWIPPFKPKYLPAVVLHDFLCDKGEYKKADEVFEEVLLMIEDSSTTRAMIKAVKIYHKLKGEYR